MLIRQGEEMLQGGGACRGDQFWGGGEKGSEDGIAIGFGNRVNDWLTETDAQGPLCA